VQNATPLFSIVTPVFNTERRVLEECIASVLSQTFDDWELCLVDDASSSQRTKKVLARAASLDSRIRVVFRDANGGIVAASNDGVAMARGQYVGLLDHDDVLEPDALEEVSKALLADTSIDYLYTDEDLLGSNGQTREAFRKPEWSPERFRNQMYVCHFSVIRRSLLKEVGGFRAGFDGSQDYDLMLRVTEKAKKIHHVPKILYHWRIIEGSVAGDPNAKPYAYTAGENALKDHCARIGVDADITHSPDLPGNYSVKRKPSKSPAPVTMVYLDTHWKSRVWGRVRDHSSETLSSLRHDSQYPALTVRPIDASSASELGLVNSVVSTIDDPLIVLGNDALEVDTPDWCSILEQFMQMNDVGMVAPYLWTENSRLFHAGYNLRPHCIETAGARISKEFTGFRAVFRCDREVSSLGAYCTMVRRDAFLQVGGFDTDLPVPYAYADLSLKIRALGYRILVTPQAHMWCFQDNNDFSTGRYRMLPEFKGRWSDEIQRDKFGGLASKEERQSDPRPLWRPQRLRHFK
jgi:O-antigen biosynthesis protein